MSDTLVVFGQTFTGVEGFKAKDDNGNIKTYGSGGQTVYTSSTGLLYTPVMTVDCGFGKATGYLITQVLTYMGSMPYLEELTLTGNMQVVINGSTSPTLLNGEGIFPVSKYPLLKKLHIEPTGLYSGNNAATVPTCFSFTHYFASYSNFTELTLGKVGGPYWNGAGYYRNKDENGNSNLTIGSTDGLTLKVYVDSYRAQGGFGNGTVAANTTIIEYDYQTGEVLTA